jgi:hypothetical protein
MAMAGLIANLRWVVLFCVINKFNMNWCVLSGRRKSVCFADVHGNGVSDGSKPE